MIRRLFIPDCHFPLHDPSAYSVMLAVARDFKPHEVVILGDWFDCYTVSKYDKHPTKMFVDLQEELEVGVTAIERINRLLKPNKIWFLEGNHEARVSKYLINNAPLLASSMVELRDLFGLPKKCNYIPYGQNGFVEFDGLYCMHGFVTGKTPAMKSLERYGRSVLFGHTHRLQEAHKKILDGPTIRAFNCGWLGDMKKAADYIQDTADWSHGFATGIFPKSGKWTVNLHTIIDHEVHALDKTYRSYKS